MKSASDNWKRGLLAALELSCAQVRRIAESGEMPEHEVRKLGREEGHLAEYTDSEIDWKVLSDELSNVEELTSLLSGVVDELETGSLVEVLLRGDDTAEARARSLRRFALIPILKGYGRERSDWRWDANLAHEVMAEWVAERVARAQGYFRTISPLRYFDGPDDAVSIDDGLVIRPFTDRDRDELWREHDHMRGDSLGGLALGRWSHAIDYRWKQPLTDPLGHDIGIDAVDDLVRVLRLFHPGKVERTMIWTRQDPPADAYTSPFLETFLYGPVAHHEYEAMQDIRDEAFNPERVSRTQIDSRDEATIGELLQRMREGWGDRRLALALRRFDSAYSRSEQEDRLIDLWVAFEALLLPDAQSRLSLKAAHRIAVLVADGPAERAEAFEQARRSYRCRSQVVHGDEPTESLDTVVGETRELARKVLRTWLLSPPQDGVDEIDRISKLGAPWNGRENENGRENDPSQGSVGA